MTGCKATALNSHTSASYKLLNTAGFPFGFGPNSLVPLSGAVATGKTGTKTHPQTTGSHKSSSTKGTPSKTTKRHSMSQSTHRSSKPGPKSTSKSSPLKTTNHTAKTHTPIPKTSTSKPPSSKASSAAVSSLQSVARSSKSCPFK